MKTLGYIALGVLAVAILVLIVFWPSDERTKLLRQSESIDALCAKDLANAGGPAERQMVTGGCEQAKKDIQDKLAVTH